MVDMNSLVWEAFAEFTYIMFQILYSSLRAGFAPGNTPGPSPLG